ncbi:MAG: hypothetical protein WAS50_01055 [Nitrospira sp.]
MIARKTLALLCLLVGCLTVSVWAAPPDQPPSSTADKVIRDTKEAVESTKQYTREQKDSFLQAVQAELGDLQIKMTELQKKTSVASAEARTELQKAIQDLEHRKNEARKRFDELNASTSSAWSKMKDGLNESLEDLKKSYRETLSKLP